MWQIICFTCRKPVARIAFSDRGEYDIVAYCDGCTPFKETVAGGFSRVKLIQELLSYDPQLAVTRQKVDPKNTQEMNAFLDAWNEKKLNDQINNFFGTNS